MRKLLILLLMLCLSLLTFTACDVQVNIPDNSVVTEESGENEDNGKDSGNTVKDNDQGGGDTENNESGEGNNKPTPVSPIEDGGTINFN